MSQTLTKKKPNKIATTIRLDPDLRNWAKGVAEKAGTDISTFITISLTDIRNGNRSSPLDPRLMAYNKYLDDMTDRIERGEEEVSGPFSTWEETEAHLLSLSKQYGSKIC